PLTPPAPSLACTHQLTYLPSELDRSIVVSCTAPEICAGPSKSRSTPSLHRQSGNTRSLSGSDRVAISRTWSSPIHPRPPHHLQVFPGGSVVRLYGAFGVLL